LLRGASKASATPSAAALANENNSNYFSSRIPSEALN